MRSDVQISRITGREAGAEHLRSSRIHSKQRVVRVEVGIARSQVAPHRGQPIALADHHDAAAINPIDGAVECPGRHRPGQICR